MTNKIYNKFKTVHHAIISFKKGGERLLASNVIRSCVLLCGDSIGCNLTPLVIHPSQAQYNTKILSFLSYTHTLCKSLLWVNNWYSLLDHLESVTLVGCGVICDSNKARAQY